MAVCANCRNEYDDSLTICPKCGARNNIAQAQEPAGGTAQESSTADGVQVKKMHKGNRRNLVIMSCVFAVSILSGFFAHGQSAAYIIGASLFLPVFVIPMLMMKKWAAMVMLLTLLALVFMAMLALIGGAYSTAPAAAFGAISAILYFLYMIIIFQNMDEMR